MTIGNVTVDENGDATGTGLSFRLFEEILAAVDAAARRAVAKGVGPFCEGLARALDQETSRIWQVGQAPWMYQNIGEAITAINADPIPPSQTNRSMVYIWPGDYEMTERVDVPGDVVIQGVSKRASTLYNATTDMFRCIGPRVYFLDLCMRGALDEDLFLIDGNNQSDIRVDRVDMVGTSGANTEKFLKQSGSAWNTLILENITISSNATAGRLIYLENTSGAARNTGVQITNLRSDMWSLTDAGGLLDCLDCQDIDLRNCHVRGSSSYCEGIRFQRAGGTTGTPYMGIQTSRFTCKYALNTSANTSVTLFNTYAKPVTGDGTINAYNSTYV